MLKLNTTKKAYDYCTARRVPVVRRVIAFLADLSTTQAQQIHYKKLREVFGKESNDFVKHLKALTLVKVSQQYIVGEQSQAYIRNEQGFQTLLDAANIDRQNVGTIVADRYEQYNSEIATGKFVYNEQGNRFYHPLQNMARENKGAFWASHGYTVDLDIECCAATLVFQAAVHSGLASGLLMQVRQYIDDKNAIRDHYVHLLGVDRTVAKEVITAMINVAKLGGRKCTISGLLNANQINALRTDKYTIGLRASVKLMWSFLARKYRFNNNGSERWAFYRKLERDVMDVVVEQCSGRVFREHDGLRTDKPVDVSAVQSVVKQKTGYEIRLDCKYTG